MTKKATKKKTAAAKEEVEIEVEPTTIQATEETSEEAPTEQPIALTPLAVKMVCEIIAVCTKRGAFNPNELTAVGNLFDQLQAQLPPEETAELESSEDGSEAQAEIPVA